MLLGKKHKYEMNERENSSRVSST
uniref:Uncharacterized protein n=1 Tax=Rhizophora mucronata TaxID=61149 RepID=A0A2P2QFC7_RHIMU